MTATFTGSTSGSLLRGVYLTLLVGVAAEPTAQQDDEAALRGVR
jgi:hypothetical protein